MIKFFCYFLISFSILSIPVKKRQLFYYLNELANPYTLPAFYKMSNFLQQQLARKKIFGMSIIAPQSNSSAPTDKVKAKTDIPAPFPLLERPPAQLDLNSQSEALEIETYSESELQELKLLLKNSDI